MTSQRLFTGSPRLCAITPMAKAAASETAAHRMRPAKRTGERRCARSPAELIRPFQDRTSGNKFQDFALDRRAATGPCRRGARGSKWLLRSESVAFQQGRDLGDAGLGASVVLLLAGAGAAHASDDLAAHLNRHAAAQREDIGHIALRRIGGIARPLLEFQRGGA